MFITITFVISNFKADIRIDSEQKVGDVLNILIESGKLPPMKIPDYFHSCIRECLISTYKTFAEEKIYDGDILTAAK